MGRHILLTVDSKSAGLRLDQAIASLCEELSRGQARRLIARGSVFLAQKRVKVAGRKVYTSQRIDIYPGELQLPEQDSDEPQLELPLVLMTRDLLVADKPSGVMSAPTPESDQHDLKSRLEREHGPLHLVHRLDRPTSGLIVLARSSEVAAKLSRQLADRSLGRRYRALLAGRHGEVGQQWEMSAPIAGKDASTRFEVAEVGERSTMVIAQLQTGRTHQIRIHAAEYGAPVLGDSKYGRQLLRGLPKPPRLALHAEWLTFLDPRTQAEVQLHSPFPEELHSYFDAL